MGVEVTIKDGGIDALIATFSSLGNRDLTVGVQGEAGRRVVRRGRNPLGQFSRAGRVTMAAVAMFNEFGTRAIPQRSFIRGALFSRREQVQRQIATAYAELVTTRISSADAALRQIGRFLAAKVRERIETSKSWAAPNAPSTIARKGFDWPLHDTGRLAKSISWAVRGPGGSLVEEGR